MRKELSNPKRINVIVESSEWEAYKKRARMSLSRLLRKSMKIYLETLSKNK